MSILPEYVLQKVIAHGIRRFREDQSLVPMLFRHLNADEVSSLQQFLRDQSIDLAVNWPDAQLKLPAIILTLKNESESQALLGNVMQGHTNIVNTGTPYRKETLTAPATVLGGGSLGQAGNEQHKLTDPLLATGGTSSTLTFSQVDPFTRTDPFEIKSNQELLVVIKEGTGAGQRRLVTKIEPLEQGGIVEVTVSSNWGTVPDNTSIFEFKIQVDPFDVGEPAKLFEEGEFIERIGAMYSASYQALVVGPNQEITLFLYAILKAILFINYEYLQQHGFIELKMGGTDFVHKPEYLPELAYQRALILEFQHAFDVYIAAESVTSIRLAVETEGDNSVVGVVSETNLDL